MENFSKKVIQTTYDNAIKNIEKGGGPFACIILDSDGFTVGAGENRVSLDNDPTAHAEIVAIRNACKNMKNFNLANCVLFTSCEPCPMCLSAIYWAGIKNVYYGSSRKDASNAGFADDFIYKEMLKPYEDRSIKMLQVNDIKSNTVFKKWSEKKDKIEY
jgi:guanine deaminase